MPLVAGVKLGPYEINAPLGAGGMGEVYRAKDTRLGREVAIKMLSSEFSSNKDRMDRFAQEARAASALNHPNIITVYDVGDQAGSFYIAMEFIDGKSLRELLQSGSLPVKRMVSIAAQIADGLAKAHEAGIVHRDLKPENIMISKDGFAKILDFGLAKSSDQAPAKGGSVLSTALHTSEGTILGTVGYMSPEQAAGRIIDFRSDQFSFGSILYEMLAGKRAFERDSQVQCMSAIIQDDPEPLQTLSPQTPAPLRWIIERCLSKDPAERYASTRDLARELQNIRDHFSDLTSSTEALSQQITPEHRSHAAHGWLKYLPWLLAIASSIFAYWIAREKSAPVTAVTRRLEVSIPRGYRLSPMGPLALSPDGTAIVLGLLDQRMHPKLWLRYLNKFDFVPIPGTEGGGYPFWSPDSKSIAFFVQSETTLRRVDLSSGINQTICKTDWGPRGGSWGPDGTILFSPGPNSAIQQVSANGGTPKDVTKLDPKIVDGSHRFPIFLPDGKNFLFSLWSNHEETALRVGGIYVGSLKNGDIRKLSSASSQVVLMKNNRLLLNRNNALQAVSFDSQKLEITEGVEEISAHPLSLLGSGNMAASASSAGDIAYALSSAEVSSKLGWVDANGSLQKIIQEERFGTQNIVIAPDGKRFAAEMITRAGAEIWVTDAERGVMTRLTRGGLDSFGPVWSADGRSIAFTSLASGNEAIYLQPSDASKPSELFFSQADRDFRVRSWSADGRSLLLESNITTRPDHYEIWMLDVTTRKAVPILTDASANLGGAVFSPDGRWLAYLSNESGMNQIYIRPYPALDRKWQISQSGILAQSTFFRPGPTIYMPHWRNDGRELLFISLNGSINAVNIETQGDNLTVGAPHVVFTPTFPVLSIAPAPDHTKFLAAIVKGDVVSEPIRIILNSKY